MFAAMCCMDDTNARIMVMDDLSRLQGKGFPSAVSIRSISGRQWGLAFDRQSKIGASRDHAGGCGGEDADPGPG